MCAAAAHTGCMLCLEGCLGKTSRQIGSVTSIPRLVDTVVLHFSHAAPGNSLKCRRNMVQRFWRTNWQFPCIHSRAWPRVKASNSLFYTNFHKGRSLAQAWS